MWGRSLCVCVSDCLVECLQCLATLISNYSYWSITKWAPNFDTIYPFNVSDEYRRYKMFEHGTSSFSNSKRGRGSNFSGKFNLPTPSRHIFDVLMVFSTQRTSSLDILDVLVSWMMRFSVDFTTNYHPLWWRPLNLSIIPYNSSQVINHFLIIKFQE